MPKSHLFVLEHHRLRPSKNHNDNRDKEGNTQSDAAATAATTSQNLRLMTDI